jgi:hypothetical protein
MAPRETLRATERSGIALLSVVVVLSTLLIIGVLFSVTVELDLKASQYYREAGQTELIALEGLYRAIAEIQYDQWGVNEKQSFKLSNNAEKLSEAAYYTTTGQPIVEARSKYFRTIEIINNGSKGVFNTVTDLRWVESAPQGVGYSSRDKSYNMHPNLGGRARDREFVHSGAVYHDEFLPEGSDVTGAWELGLHVNRGGIYWEGEQSRLYKWDKDDTSKYWFDPNHAGGNTGWDNWFWYEAYQSEPWLKRWDYIDTRINDDSFFKIFRFELVYFDGSSWRSNAAGVYDKVSGMAGKQIPRTKWFGVTDPDRGRTHLGKTVKLSNPAFDPRGEASNINPVNNNYLFEANYAQATPNGEYQNYHYADSKWIYLYSEDGQTRRGRFATLVWPDSGYPSANYMLDASEQPSPQHGDWNSLRRADSFFALLDTLFSPRGGPIGASNTNIYDSTIGANILKSPTADGVGGSGWSRALSKRIDDHVDVNGLISSRAELHMLLRKDTLTGATIEETEEDATIISSSVTVHAYELMMGPHWEVDRILIDYLGHSWDGYFGVGGNALYAPSAFSAGMAAATTESMRTRQVIWHYLDNLKYYWGPDELREGQYTPYTSINDRRQDTGVDSGERSESHVTKSVFFGHFLAAGFSSNYGIDSFNVDARNPRAVTYVRNPSNLDARLSLNSVMTNPFAPQINEVGRIDPTVMTAAFSASTMALPNAVATLAGGGGGRVSFVEVIDQRPYPCNCGTTNSNTFDLPGVAIEVSDNGTSWTNVVTNGNCVVISMDGASNWGSDNPWVWDRPDSSPASSANSDEVNNNRRNNQPTFSRWDHAQQSINAKESTGRYNNSAYAVFYFLGDGRFVRMKYNGKLIDQVALPGSLSQGYSTYDHLNNQNPAAWMLTNNIPYNAASNLGLATPCWQRKAPYYSGQPNFGGVNTYTYTSKTPANQAWYHGQNVNNYMTYVPGGESWPRPISDALPSADKRFAIIDIHGHGSSETEEKGLFKFYGVSGLRGSDDDSASAVAMGRWAWYQSMDHDWGFFLRHRGKFSSAPLGFYALTPQDSRVKTSKLVDPFLRYFSDLGRVAPIERYISSGWLRWPLNTHFEHSYYDNTDNNQDGIVDNITTNPRFRGAELYRRSQGGQGHYLGDRAAIGRINGNEIQHPGAVWYAGIGASHDKWGGATTKDYDYANVVIGKKPFRGYNHWSESLSRACMVEKFHANRVPYHMGFWYENQFADADTWYAPSGQSTNHMHHTTVATSRNLYMGNGSVYTIYVTAQSLDTFEKPLSEIKILATIERTWDGKSNLLDFRWIPSDIASIN